MFKEKEKETEKTHEWQQILNSPGILRKSQSCNWRCYSMAFAAITHQTCITTDSGGSNHKDHDMLLSLVPIHKVTHEPQLPAEFLNLPIDLKLIDACKPGLESTYIMKVIHDHERDNEALYFQFNLKLFNVLDIQLAHYLIEEQEGRKRLPSISNVEKKEVRMLLREDPKFWTYRPLSELMICAAAGDVHFSPIFTTR
ncbi:hypothetical protein M9H77_37213 [Catharanthus roseus]|uniref:Uncharacterized protein n=1 Tax=Catharanthus roseus TaxID=4058 RepID=A0ACB9ZUS9_CATRO|nr:hypothetical protein M9H77_37213 [Catharanthus roseus]